MERPKRLCVREINAHLICVLCGGYYVDATTIGECLHSFCRSCIVKYLETNKFCPICDVQLHKAKPLLSIRPDKILQKLVYKMVPGLYANEMQRRRSFYSNTELQSSTDSESCDSYQHNKYSGQEFFSPEDSISLSLEYYGGIVSSDSEAESGSTSSNDKKQVPHRRYLQCPAAVTTNHLKKFVRMKYGLTTDHRVDIIYEDECLPDYFSLMDVAYTFSWDRATPMRFCYRILERSIIRTTVPNNVMVPETAPTASSELDATVNATTGTPAEINESPNKTTDQQVNDRVQGKGSLRDACEENNNCADEDEEEASEEPPAKKSRSSPKVNDASTEDDKLNEEEQSQEMECNADDSNTLDAAEEEGEDDDSDENAEKNNNENFQTEDNVNENEASNGAEADEAPEDFILQNDQQIDINDDLEEEDDDEDRLRICDPEEETTEERTADEVAAEPAEEPMDEVQTEEAVDEQVNLEELPPQQPDNEEIEEEEEEEEEKPKEVPKAVEYKSKKKNKKGKHHHHHRHRRDYHPEAHILHSDDTKNDIMKLKVKLTAVKSDENSKYYKLNSHSPSRHKHYVISEESDNVSNHSQDVSNVDDDSRNSQLTDDRDIDIRSVASSKEGLDSDSKGSPASSSHSVSSGSKQDSPSSNKERLLQMRAVRHKNVSSAKEVSSSGPSTNGRMVNDSTTTGKSKSSIILQPPSSITVSKITAAEKRKMDEEKLMMMSGKNNNNGMDNNRPSVEIMLVNAPKQGDGKSQQGDKMGYKKSPSPSVPLVNIIKTTAPMASPSSQRHQSSVSITSKLHNKVRNNVKTSSVSSNSDKSKYSLGGKSSTDESATGNSQGKRVGGGTHDDVGALDLSGKSSRKSSSSSLSPLSSEGSNCPSPKHNALSVAQSLMQRHLPGLNHTGRASSNSPSEVTTPIAHSSPETGRSMIPAAMWNLMTLSDTAVHIRNMKAAQDVPGKPQAHSQKNMSSQRPLPSPTKSPSTVANRSSPSPLKIPVPNLALNNKNFTNKNRTLPNLNEITSSAATTNRTKTGMIHNRNNNNIPLNKPGTVRPAPGISLQPRPGCGLNFSGMINRQGPSPAVAKKQAGINGRGLLIPPPPPVIPISSILKMENMTRKYDIDKVASGLTAVKAAVEAYGGKL